MKTFARVVVLDDQQKHLDIIVRALGRAGFAAISYLVDGGAITPEPDEPCNGLRLVFSDIHLTPTSGISGTDNIGILGQFLRRIAPKGPYGLILWSKYAEDEKEIVQSLKDRADDLAIQLPVFFGFIDKKLVLTDADDDAEEVEEKDPGEFKKAILDELEKCPTLMAIMEWEERAFLATNFTSDSLFQLSSDPDENIQAQRWLNLISYLAQESVGASSAKQDPLRAIDNALLPILEDQFRYSLPQHESASFNQIKEKLSGKRVQLPEGISTAKLHSFYLVEKIDNKNYPNYARGTVSSVLAENFDEFFARCFSLKWRSLLIDEFIVSGPERKILEEARQTEKFEENIHPCVISLSPECDDVQGKVVTHRYLLGIVFKKEFERFFESAGALARDALHRVGTIEHEGEEHILIISCRRFFSCPAAATKNLPIVPFLRLRKSTVDEISHHYTTYARRPGVMRFS